MKNRGIITIFIFPDPDVKHKPNPDGILLNGNSNSAPTIYDHGKRKIEVRKHGIILPPSHLLEGFQSLKTSVQVFLSDQNILSPFIPNYDNGFCQIYKNCSEIQNPSFASFEL